MFWQRVLDNNNISYDTEYVVKKRDLGIDDNSNYFLDFLLLGNIDLEIDGKQHEYEERKLHDKERDKNLSKGGFLIYRIKWINPTHSEEVSKQINVFLNWFNSKQQNKDILN